MPVGAAELKSFEKLNPIILVTAIVWEEDDNKPQCLCYVSHNCSVPKHALLLFYNNHWLPIMNLDCSMGCENVNSACIL